MQKNTDIQKRQKKDAVQGVLLFALLQAVGVAAFIALCLIPGLPTWAVVLFAALAAGCVLLVIAAVAVLKQRFDEIQGGELDAARQY